MFLVLKTYFKEYHLLYQDAKETYIFLGGWLLFLSLSNAIDGSCGIVPGI